MRSAGRCGARTGRASGARVDAAMRAREGEVSLEGANASFAMQATCHTTPCRPAYHRRYWAGVALQQETTVTARRHARCRQLRFTATLCPLWGRNERDDRPARVSLERQFQPATRPYAQR
ncbi:hypothetical protein Bcen2424_4446 [Burkholderia cenocepacia HI2424]|nr:hypothetical protein Bcen2424_4446 [Burkholderia cenocepacia HI2424]